MTENEEELVVKAVLVEVKEGGGGGEAEAEAMAGEGETVEEGGVP